MATEIDKVYEYKISDDTIDIEFSAQDIDDLLKTTMASVTIPTYNIGAMGSSYTISTTSGSNGTSWGNTNNNWTYSTTSPIATATDNKLHVKGDTVIEGDLKVDGVSFKETIESINKRLAILRPDPEKLEHFEALRKAYEHYKTLEALCELPSKKEDK